jgi:hypothetical protein
MKRYEKCCCFPARIGVLVLAVLGITGGIIGIITNSLIVSNGTLLREAHLDYILTRISCIGIVISILNTFINGSMMYGVVKNKSVFLKPWLVLSMIEVVIFGVATPVGFIGMLVEGAFDIAALIITIGILTSCLNCYFWTVVRSVYHDIQEDKYAYPAAAVCVLEAGSWT